MREQIAQPIFQPPAARVFPAQVFIASARGGDDDIAPQIADGFLLRRGLAVLEQGEKMEQHFAADILRVLREQVATIGFAIAVEVSAQFVMNDLPDQWLDVFRKKARK